MENDKDYYKREKKRCQRRPRERKASGNFTTSSSRSGFDNSDQSSNQRSSGPGRARERGARDRATSSAPISPSARSTTSPLASCFNSSLAISTPSEHSSDTQQQQTPGSPPPSNASMGTQPDLGGTWAEHMQQQEVLLVSSIKSEGEGGSTHNTPIIHETIPKLIPIEVSTTEANTILHYVTNDTITATAAPSPKAPSILEEPMDVSEASADGPPPPFASPNQNKPVAAHEPQNRPHQVDSVKQGDDRFQAIIPLLKEIGQKSSNTQANNPLTTNPSVASVNTRPQVTNSSTLLIEPHTVEELTAIQLRTVFDYIVVNNPLRDRVRELVLPPKQTTPARSQDYDDAARIVYLLQTLQQLGQNITLSFHNLAVELVRGDPLDFRYTHLMGWIHELTHGITAITVHKDQLNEIILPRFLDWSTDLDYFRATMQLFHITQDTVREVLMYTSAVTAHATRMIRVLEAHQMAHMMSRRRLRVTEADVHYRFDSRTSWPKKWSQDPTSYLQSLRWWRENFSNSLMISVTNGYLQKSALGQQKHDGNSTRLAQATSSAPTTQTGSNPTDDATNTPAHKSAKTHLGNTQTKQHGPTTPRNPRLSGGAEPKPQPHLPYEPSRVDKPLPHGPPQAGQKSKAIATPRGDSQGKGKRRLQTNGVAREHESPPPKSHAASLLYGSNNSLARGRSGHQGQYAAAHSTERPLSPNSWSKPPAPTVPPPGTDPCAFCSSRQHFTSDCVEFPWLSVRASMAEKYDLCSNCVKKHYGDCVRKDPCSRCYKTGHHRTFCVKNVWAKPDIRMPAEQFYTELARRTYRHPPPGANVRQPHYRSRHHRPYHPAAEHQPDDGPRSHETEDSGCPH